MNDVCDMMTALHRRGSTIGDAEFAGEAGERLWVVSRTNGENRIVAEGPSEDVAWQAALAPAREIGMRRR